MSQSIFWLTWRSHFSLLARYNIIFLHNMFCGYFSLIIDLEFSYLSWLFKSYCFGFAFRHFIQFAYFHIIFWCGFFSGVRLQQWCGCVLWIWYQPRGSLCQLWCLRCGWSNVIHKLFEWGVRKLVSHLIHWSLNKMAAILQATFFNAFCWQKICLFRLKFHWHIFPVVMLAINQEQSRKRFGV